MGLRPLKKLELGTLKFVTLTPRFDLESFLSVFSLAAVVSIGFTKSYILLLGTSAGCYSALFLLSASSAFVKHCMIQNKEHQGHRREVLHVRRNHGITTIVILRRIGRPLGEIFIFLLVKNTALLPVNVECTRFRWCSFRHLYGQSNQGHHFTTRYEIRTKSHFPWLCSRSHLVYSGADI